MTILMKNCYPRVKKDIIIQEYKKDERGQFYIISLPEKNRYIKTHELGRKFLNLVDGTRTLDEIFILLNEGYYEITEESFNKLVDYFSVKSVISGAGTYPNIEIKEKPNDFFIFNHVLIQNISKLSIYSFLQNKTESFFTKKFGFFLLILNIIGIFFSVSIYLTSTEIQIINNLNISSISLLIVIYCIFILTISLHELGHALACSKYGGTPKEVGIALLLVIPAMYIQTRGTWTMSDKDAIKIYLAGPIVSFSFAATASIFYYLVDNPQFRCLLVIIVFLNQSAMLLTLYPFIPNDGYFVLERLTSFPNLMGNTIKMWINFVKGFFASLVPKKNQNQADIKTSVKRWSRKEIIIGIIFGPFYFLSLTIFIVPIIIYSWLFLFDFVNLLIQGNFQYYFIYLSKNTIELFSLLISFLFQFIIIKKYFLKK